ncbi:hypothetical protein [Amycolatopsis lurida]|uniref:hypothetical protein n=1 Tax=Amycolatopsis lurida TaxID=31959 RepID=UPI003660BD44
MTGPEHYTTAEDLLTQAAKRPAGSEASRYFAAAAQAHATPALAAATAISGQIRTTYSPRGYVTGMRGDEARAWDAVAGEES